MPYRPHYKWGFATGLGMATLYSGMAIVLAVLQRNIFFARYGVTLWVILAGYYAAGALCGLALSFIYPLWSYRWGSLLSGFILAALASGAMGFAMYRLHPVLPVIMLFGGLMGAGLGVVEFDNTHPKAVGDHPRDA